MHVNSFRIFYERVSPYGSIMCEGKYPVTSSIILLP